MTQEIAFYILIAVLFVPLTLLCFWQYIKEQVFTWIRINLQGDPYNEAHSKRPN
jgi:hypothetical protein